MEKLETPGIDKHFRRATLARAIGDIMANSCIRFVKYEPELHRNYLFIVSPKARNACFSPVGNICLFDGKIRLKIEKMNIIAVSGKQILALAAPDCMTYGLKNTLLEKKKIKKI